MFPCVITKRLPKSSVVCNNFIPSLPSLPKEKETEGRKREGGKDHRVTGHKRTKLHLAPPSLPCGRRDRVQKSREEDS